MGNTREKVKMHYRKSPERLQLTLPTAQVIRASSSPFSVVVVPWKRLCGSSRSARRGQFIIIIVIIIVVIIVIPKRYIAAPYNTITAVGITLLYRCRYNVFLPNGFSSAVTEHSAVVVVPINRIDKFCFLFYFDLSFRPIVIRPFARRICIRIETDFFGNSPTMFARGKHVVSR